MQMLTTFSELRPDEVFADLVPDTFRLRLTEVTGQYDGEAIEMPRVEILRVSHTSEQGLPEALELLLAASFDAPSAERLKPHFPAMEAFALGIEAYVFSMKPEALSRYGADYTQTIELPALLGIGEGALLNLAHYELFGYYSFS